MGRRHSKPNEIIANLREVEVGMSQGESVVQAIRAISVSEQTYYRWRREYGVSERGACNVVIGQHRSTQRKKSVGRADEEAITKAIIRLAEQ